MTYRSLGIIAVTAAAAFIASTRSSAAQDFRRRNFSGSRDSGSFQNRRGGYAQRGGGYRGYYGGGREWSRGYVAPYFGNQGYATYPVYDGYVAPYSGYEGYAPYSGYDGYDGYDGYVAPGYSNRYGVGRGLRLRIPVPRLRIPFPRLRIPLPGFRR